MRPSRLVMVLGTGTGVGKTWVTATVVEQLRSEGLGVAARKPVQSFSPGEMTDAQILARASGETPDEVCDRRLWFERPLAPPIAAQALRRPPFTVADLAEELAWPAAVDVGFIEGAGGVRSPLAGDGDAVDLAAIVVPDVVLLVADSGLGTLNLIRMSLDALVGHLVVVFLNRFDRSDETHRLNLEWLEAQVAQVAETDLGRLASRMTISQVRPARYAATAPHGGGPGPRPR